MNMGIGSLVFDNKINEHGGTFGRPNTPGGDFMLDPSVHSIE